MVGLGEGMGGVQGDRQVFIWILLNQKICRWNKRSKQVERGACWAESELCFRHSQWSDSLPVWGVLYTWRSKRPCTEGTRPTGKEIVELYTERGESWKKEGGDKGRTCRQGQSAERGCSCLLSWWGFLVVRWTEVLAACLHFCLCSSPEAEARGTFCSRALHIIAWNQILTCTEMAVHSVIWMTKILES